MQLFTHDDHMRLAQAQTYTEACQIALRQLDELTARDGRPVGIVCGPISTGGLGSISENLKRFNETIVSLMDQGFLLFNQMPYEDVLHRIKATQVSIDEYDMNLLTDFYEPLFASGCIKWQAFIHDWRGSTGTRWEFKQLRQRGIMPLFLNQKMQIKKTPFEL